MVLLWMEHGSINHFIQELQNEGHFEDGKAWVHLWVGRIELSISLPFDSNVCSCYKLHKVLSLCTSRELFTATYKQLVSSNYDQIH